MKGVINSSYMGKQEDKYNSVTMPVIKYLRSLP